MTARQRVHQALTDMGRLDYSDYAERVAQIESSWNPQARARSSTATGLFQFIRGTWGGVRPGVSFSHARDPYQSTQAFVDFSESNRAQLRDAIGRDPAGYELYMAHFAGMGVAPRLITAQEDTPLREIFDRGAMRANRHLGRLRTAGNYREWVRGKYEGAGDGVPQERVSYGSIGDWLSSIFGGGNSNSTGFSSDRNGINPVHASREQGFHYANAQTETVGNLPSPSTPRVVMDFREDHMTRGGG